MSTFLELVQELHSECGASGVAPTSVVSQTGEAKNLVDWIAKADVYVQKLWHNWKFLYKQYSQTTAVGVGTLARPSDHSYWDLDTFKVDSNPVCVEEWDKVKGEVLDTSSAYPGRVIVMPDESLLFEPYPDSTYAVTADYYTKPVKMAANADESPVPEEFEQVIIGRALILYANYEGSPEIKAQGEEIYVEFLARLEDKCLPNQQYSRFAPRHGGGFEVIAG